MKLRIDEIVVGERRREDMGDINSLAESIRQFGLLHPIVVDDQKRLVAGGRRLEACKRLGWKEISVTFLGELTDKQLREIELEENLRRKDLTEYEKSKNLVELAEIKAEALKKQQEAMSRGDIVLGTRDPEEKGYSYVMPSEEKSNWSPSDQFSRRGGRGKSLPDSKAKIAEAIGVAKTTLIEAEQHVRAVEQYPELAPLPKTHAIEIARQLRSLPEPMRQKKRQQLQEIQEVGQRREERIEEIFRIKKTFHQALYGVATLDVSDERLNAWLSDMPQAELQRQWELVEEGIANLTVLRDYFRKIFGGPRLVQLGGGKS